MNSNVFRFLAWMTLLAISSTASARVTPIINSKDRANTLEQLNALLNYEDLKLKEQIPFTVNPFYFEQPLILKLKAPGGLKDDDVLTSLGSVLVGEISGAFVRGSKRSLLMKSGDLVKEGDTVTRVLNDFGGMEISAVIDQIDRSQFVLRLNNSIKTVQLSSSE